MPWKLVVLEQMQGAGGYPWRRGWCTTRAPMETGMSEESDADAATSTPGGGHG
jgi:hypothetical protein